MKRFKEIAHNAYYATAAWMFAFGIVIGPIAVLLSMHVVNTTFSVPAWVPSLVYLVLFLSMFVDLVVVGVLVAIGNKKKSYNNILCE